MAEAAKLAAKEAKEAKESEPSKPAAAGVPRDSMYRSLFTPAGWAFAIWGVIFMGEAVFTAAQAMPGLSPAAAAVYAAIAPWFVRPAIRLIHANMRLIHVRIRIISHLTQRVITPLDIVVLLIK